MRVRLLAKHVIGGNLVPANTVLDLPKGVQPTVEMEPIDDEAKEAIAAERRRVYPDGIERATPPVWPGVGGGGPGR